MCIWVLHLLCLEQLGVLMLPCVKHLLLYYDFIVSPLETDALEYCLVERDVCRVDPGCRLGLVIVVYSFEMF